MGQPRVIISGGGTGGHVFPAIAIANAIKVKHPNADILFVGAEGRMEMEKVPAAGYTIKGLWISGLQRKLTLKNLSFPFKVIASLWKARQIIKEFKPQVAVGVGGYASGPLLHVACANNIPALIQEQNSFPGITNKLLAKKVRKICVAYDGMGKFFPKDKIILTGNPVRQDITNLNGKRERGIEYFKLDTTKKTILVIGGSLGARTINQAVEELLETLKTNNIQLVWQTGKSYYSHAESIIKPYKEFGITAHQFISKMDYAYAVADVVISRAGAISVSELMLSGKASILIPSPNVSEDHQTKNAMALVNHKAAILIKDIEAKKELKEVVFSLLQNDEKRNKLIENISGLAYRDSADVIADEVIKLIEF